MGQPVKISQCMIVKNEEKNIEKALSWGKGIVFEQIVVDTGSTDRTIEIAKQMGAKIYQFEWIDDFAAAKNYAIEQAAGEWIAFLDADEYLSREDAEKLPKALEKLRRTEYKGIAMAWLQLNDQGVVFSAGTQFRVFRNIPTLRYQGRIHETLSIKDGKVIAYDGCGEFSIFHTGYSKTSSKSGKKGERNMLLIKKELEEHPDDYAMMGYLADAYDSMGDKKQAREWYYKAIANMPEDLPELDNRSVMTFEFLLMVLKVFRADEEEMANVYTEAARRFPKEADFDYFMGQYYREKGCYTKAAKHLRRSIRLVEKYGISGHSMVVGGRMQEVWEYLAEACYYSGDMQGCTEAAVTVLRFSPHVPGMVEYLLKAFFESSKQENEDALISAIMGFLMKLYNLDNRKDRLFLAMTLGKLPYNKLTELLRSVMPKEELEAIDAAENAAGDAAVDTVKQEKS